MSILIPLDQIQSIGVDPSSGCNNVELEFVHVIDSDEDLTPRVLYINPDFVLILTTEGLRVEI